MKKKIKTALLMAVVAAVGFCSYKAYGSYVAGNVSEEDLLLAENVEALSAGDSQDYSGYAKDYETGEGMYVTEITGEVSGQITIGMKISNSLLAELKGKVKAERKPEWKMTCQKNMGCYTTCSNEDWHMGKKEDKLVRGC